MKNKIPKIKELIEKANKILIAGHRDPDGDSLGSMLALKIALQNRGKKVTAVSAGPLSKQFNFLPYIWQIEKIKDIKNFDLIFCLDYGAPERIDLPPHLIRTISSSLVPKAPVMIRCGGEPASPSLRSTIITIDHHPSDAHIGQIRLIDIRASSDCEILYSLFKNFGWEITKDMAICLLTGLITDTESFRNQNTTSYTLTVAGQLLSRAGSFNKIIKYSLCSDSKTIKLWGKILDRITIDKKIGLVIAALSYQDSQKIGIHEEDLSGFTNFLKFIKEAKVSLVLFEKEPQKIKGSLRSENIDIASLAEKLGGGGHKLAAGFEAEGKIQDIVETVKNYLTLHP